MRGAVALLLIGVGAGAVGGCGEGTIYLTSGEQLSDATVPPASTLEGGAPSDGAPSDGSDGWRDAPPSDAVATDAGALDASAADAPSGCATDLDCPLATLHCDVSSHACVPCVNDDQCTTPGLPRCDVARHVCVGCGVTADCPAGSICDPASLSCLVPCNDAGRCSVDDQTCNARGYCATCTVDGGGCKSSSVCDDERGTCGQCTVDSDCTSATLPHCDRETDKCVQCILSSDCPAAKPVCDPSTWSCIP